MSYSKASEQPFLANPRKHPVNTLDLCDNLDDKLHHLKALIEPLVMTDFIEDVDSNSLRAYLDCMQDKIEEAQVWSNKIMLYFGYTEEKVEC